MWISRFRTSKPAVAALLLFVFSFGSLLSGKEKKLPSGEAGNDVVQILATALDSEQLKQTFGSDFNNGYAVI